MTDLHFRLLGPTEISVAGWTVKPPGPAERSLLAQLLLTPSRTVPATLLVDRLWSETALPEDPLNALQTRVSKLRRTLSNYGIPGAVEREGSGYRLNVAPHSVDAVDFAARVTRVRSRWTQSDDPSRATDQLDAYDEALALWRGKPLVDFASEAWAVVEAARLNDLRLSALTERAQLALNLGRHLEVVGDLEPWVAHDPTLESLTGLLMVALYRSDRQANALEVYTRTRRVLDEELGLEPSLSLRSLHERILRQDPSLEAQPHRAPAPAGAATRRRREEAPSTNVLPIRARILIGRDADLDAITQLLGDVRLLTLIGSGGAGKTSLALAAVASVQESYPDGAHGVRLASVTNSDQVPLAVADALAVPLDGAAADNDVRARLFSFLARRNVLLLMDNCEHVVDAAAALIDEILSRCPGVKVLATSREALAVPDEVQCTVGPLEAPPDSTPTAQVLSYPAAQLFIERARKVRPGLLFDGAELDAVGRITRALDGIPLALELAASRVAAMSPAEIAERLDDRFSLLTSGARTAEARQQTLRATVDWSYALLDEHEQRVFNRLTVFRSGWTLTAAEAVVADTYLPMGKVVDIVGRLVARSLVVVDRGPVTRYRMLQTLQQYAADRLAECDESAVIQYRHAEYYRAFAAEAERDLRGRSQRQALGRLRDEQPNVRAALTWFEAQPDKLDAALAMAGSLGLFWHLGRHLEGRDVLARLLARGPGASTARAHALQAVSLVERPRACLVHPSARCAAAAEESLQLFEAAGDVSRAALSKVLVAVEGVTGHDPIHCETLLGEAEEQFTADGDAWGCAVVGFVRMEAALKTGDETHAIPTGRSTAAAFRHLDDPWGLSATLYHLGWGLRQFGRYEEGARVLEEAIDVAASAGLFNTVQWALADLGVAQLHLGNLDSAHDLFQQAAAASEHIGDGAGAALSAYGHGLLAQAAADWPRARDRFVAASQGFTDLGTPVMQGAALLGLARCDEADGASARAERGYKQAADLGRDAGEPALLASALEGLARLRRACEPEADAHVLELLNRAHELRTGANRPATPLERRDEALTDNHVQSH